MKRAVHVFFWISVLVAIAAVLMMRGKKSPVGAAQPMPPEPALAPKPAPAHLAQPVDIPPNKIAPATNPAAPATPPSSAPSSEADFMRQIRDNVRANPELALSLAREARQQFGDSAQSDERDKLLVDALVNLQKIGAARDETGYYYRHHPAGQYRQYLWAMTGARPDPPTGPANGR
jgi:hypothetical protein